MRYYHATSEQAAMQIVHDGVIRTGFDGVVYLCTDKFEAARFPMVRGIRDIIAIGVDLPENAVEESFDHSEEFFKCKAYWYGEDIPLDSNTTFERIIFNKEDAK